MKKSEAIKTRTIPFVFSDETRDSYGTVIPAKSWDLSRFNKIGIALYNHASYGNDPDNVIGSARAWVEGKQLLGEITFEVKELNPKAEKVFQKLLAGTIKGCSVGFRSDRKGKFGEGEESIDGKNPTYYYHKCELIEISVTPFPANPNAKVRSERAGEEEDEEPENNYRYAEVRSFDPEDKGEEKADEMLDESVRAVCAIGESVLSVNKINY